MITKLSYYISEGLNPYRNQAVEEYLFNKVSPGECILYLWQNANTVVIGKNQNARAEVRVKSLEEDGGHLARRLSGGGAVYHDLGNLNFTFLVREDDYDLEKQCSVILNMARSFGINAEQTGRNDILAEGRKFSGNAYYKSGNHCYHHGTIMVDVDKTPLERYLNVPVEKLESKGVASVRSRVVNLKELKVDIDVENVKTAMIQAFGQVYGIQPNELEKSDLDEGEINALEEKYASYEWRLGKEFPFSFSISKRYDWGGLEVQIAVKDGKVEAWKAYSDALTDEKLNKVEELLNCRLQGAVFSEDLPEKILEDLN